MHHYKQSLLALSLALAQFAHAAPGAMSERSEAHFLKFAGAHAVAIAPHLYRVEKGGNVRMFAFGRDAVDQLNAMVAGNLQAVDPAAARRFSEKVAEAIGNGEKDHDGRIVSLCGGGVTAQVSADSYPGFAYHGASATAVLTHNQANEKAYSGSVYTEALACLPMSGGGESCSSPYGQSASNGASGSLSPWQPGLSVDATVSTLWPSFSFSRLLGYALASCGRWDATAAYVCQGDGTFNTCR
ncbi:MAG: hypothetical protein IPK27_15160 [Rhodanobacteraceae bacterium]|nr:hypothetical protein [Rhodanobacteraceae bacterium]